MLRLSTLLLTPFSVLIYPALISTVVLYIYPLFFGCEFPLVHSPTPQAVADSSQDSQKSSESSLAPFRLLALGDPQLEGDTSLPDYSSLPVFPSFEHLYNLNSHAVWRYNQDVLRVFYNDLVKQDLPLLLWSYRKRLDLLGNDFYLAHQHRTLKWWLRPTHTAVLGDLLGSQWIDDPEFESRADRFWNRVFRGGLRVEDAAADPPGQLRLKPGDWNEHVINVPGNHDVGYAGDITPMRMYRYERAFGRTNWDVIFDVPSKQLDGSSEETHIRMVTLNSMNLDGPALHPDIQGHTYDYLNDLIRRGNIESNNRTLTLLLTHIPLPKPAGVCTDSEYFNYWTEEDSAESGSSGLREQNHLSTEAARPILEGIFGLSANPLQYEKHGRKGLILTGHDHEGCDVYHYANLSAPRDGREWTAIQYDSPAAKPLKENSDVPGIREVTLRSMMGEYGGHAGLVSAWWDEKEGWRVEVGSCDLGVQHWWWAVHVLDLTVVLLAATGSVAWGWEAVQGWRNEKRLAKERERRRRLERRRRSKSRSKSISVRSTPAGSRNGSIKTPMSAREKVTIEQDVRGSVSVRRRRKEEM